MELREAAQEIRDTVSMDAVLSLYGYQARHGFMVCPFHGDRDASLKVYPGTKGWHCFGCGRGGSVIDFVMEHDGCNFGTAVKALDEALGLSLLKDDDPLDYYRKRRLTAILDEITAFLVGEIDRKQRRIENGIRETYQRYREIESKPKAERTTGEWTEAANLLEGMRYEEYRKEKLDELREEVKAWRREKRRASTKAR